MKHPQGRGKRRRSAEPWQQRTSDTADLEDAAWPREKEAVAERPGRGQDGVDTDEEVLSQLVTESVAASRKSQSQNWTRAAAGREEPATTRGPATATSSTEAMADRDRPTIMEMLRDGLEQLRSAALGRDEVYELEDVLMDMKRELFSAEKRGRKKTKRAAG